MSELRNEIAWSWSRDKTLRRCARQYYWHYYGTWGSWWDDAPAEVKHAARLKRLTNFDLLVGDAIHKAIARALLHRPAQPCFMPEDAIAEDAQRLFEIAGQQAELADAYYGVPGLPERRALAEAKLAHCLEGLRACTWAKRLFRVPRSRLRWLDDAAAPFEARMVNTEGGYTLFGAPDVAVEDREGRLHVIDWKTGKRDDSDRLQLTAYALFLALKLNLNLDRIHGHLVYLLDPPGRQVESAGVLEDVAPVLGMITDLYADVRSRLSDVERNIAGDIERFEMTEHFGICARCNFRELCGRSASEPSATDQ
ncbi:MAG: PD-(D/E)XK nuclease family protein [bacterium]|nr:PD-(D/E)XK nuclease family protein [bacterium]